MALKFAILGLLKTFGESSGYDIKQQFTRSVSNVWEADLSQIYRTLDRLEQDNLVASQPDPDSNRGRKVYHITVRGQQSLENWLQEDYELAPIREPALLRLFFSKNISPARVVEQVQAYRAHFTEIEAGYDAIEQLLDDLIDRGWEDAFFQKLTLNLGRRYTFMTIEWCDYVLQELGHHFPDLNISNDET